MEALSCAFQVLFYTERSLRVPVMEIVIQLNPERAAIRIISMPFKMLLLLPEQWVIYARSHVENISCQARSDMGKFQVVCPGLT